MKKIYRRQLLFVCVASLLLQICGLKVFSQQQNPDTAQPSPQEQDEDVLRISTDLVQVGVSVFDRQGKFVEGLKKEDFELKVDGKLVEVGFFERVAAGDAVAAAPRNAPRGDYRAKLNDRAAEAVVLASPPDRGRSMCFFVDDVHLAADSLKRAKETISKFIDNEMGPNDLVAIVPGHHLQSPFDAEARPLSGACGRA